MIADGGYSSAPRRICYVSEMNEALIHGTLTECYEVGRALRLAVEEVGILQRQPQRVGSHTYAAARCQEEWWDKIGYYWVTTNRARATRRETRSGSKQNHVAENGEPFRDESDMLQVIDAKTGMPLTNNKIRRHDVRSSP